MFAELARFPPLLGGLFRVQTRCLLPAPLQPNPPVGSRASCSRWEAAFDLFPLLALGWLQITPPRNMKHNPGTAKIIINEKV